MIRGHWCATALLLTALQALAQSPADKCLPIDEDKGRLACFDEAMNRAPKQKAEARSPAAPIMEASAVETTTPEKKSKVQLTLRQSGDFNNFGGADLVDKPAQFNVQRSDGKDATSAKAALIAAFRPINDLGWQPFASGAWNRDTAAAKPKDIRDLSVGVAGPLWDPLPSGWTLYSTLRFTHRDDRYGTADSDGLALHTNVVILRWVSAIPDPVKNSYSLVPQFGYLAENRNGGALDAGAWRSLYGGFQAAAQLNGWVPRLALSLDYQRFIDTSVPSGNDKRRVNHALLALTYALTDPDDKAITFRPYLSLSREVGTDVLGGGSPTNRTIFGLGLKYN